MKCCLPVLLILALVASPANAWNNKGHMVVARLAWKDLEPAQRALVLKTLEVHPHIEEFLKAHRPANIAEDEWVFLRAATWADWVRTGPAERTQFSRPTAHYINIPLVPPGSKVDAPGAAKVNIVTQIGASQTLVKKGSREEAAVHLCWLCHLVGDIHQPLALHHPVERGFSRGRPRRQPRPHSRRRAGRADAPFLGRPLRHGDHPLRPQQNRGGN